MSDDVTFKLQRPRVEEILLRYKSQIGKDFLGYRNHVYRVITYAMLLLDNADKYEQLIETAFAYHGIGLWVEHELAYLELSEDMAVADNEKYGWGLDPDELRGIIHWHHKIFPYKGSHRVVIEACRKADWIDVSMGNLQKGIHKSTISKVEASFPNFGFHKALLRITRDYNGSVILGTVKIITGIVKF